MLQILITPSFEPPVSWEIYENVSGDEGDPYFAVYTVWRLDIDLQKIEEPDMRLPVERRYRPRLFTPTIETQSLSLDIRFVADLFARFKKAAVPVFVQNPQSAGLDGTSYDISYNPTFGISASFHWWAEPPAEWQPLARFLSDLVAYLTQLL